MPKAKVPKRARTTKARAPTTKARASTTKPRRHISSFEKLPCELRQQIYFYLGFPIAGRCLHTCDDSCMPMAYRKIGYKNQRGEMRVTKCLSKTKITRTESDEDPEFLLKHSPTCFHQVKPLRGIQSSSGNDEVHHLYDTLAGIGLMGTNRFFYHDTAACLYNNSLACSCVDEKRKKIRQPRKR